MNEADEIMKLEKLEFREFINNVLKFLCFYIIYCIKDEIVLLYIGVAYLMYATFKIIMLIKLASRKYDIYINNAKK